MVGLLEADPERGAAVRRKGLTSAEARKQLELTSAHAVEGAPNARTRRRRRPRLAPPRLSDDLAAVLAEAMEAARARPGGLQAEHLWLGIVRTPWSPAARTLRKFQIDAADVEAIG